MPTITFNCATCAKQVTSKKKPKNSKNYCSKQCYYNSLVKPQHIRQCLQCKQDFVLHNIAYEKRGHGKYCSMQCSKYATKKHSFDEKFFDKIDAEIKAYWLGFCMADGCNTGDELRIELSTRDEKHLLKFKNDLQASQSVSHRDRGTYGMSSFGVASRHMCSSLSKLGCIPNKTFTLKVPSIPESLMRHFIRGYFDGDGSLYVHQSGNKAWSLFSVSQEFILSIKEIIEKQTSLELHYYSQGENGHRLVSYKAADIQNIFYFLYDNATVCMDRKRENF